MMREITFRPPLRYNADYRALGFVAALCAFYGVQYLGLMRHPLLLLASCILSLIVLVVRHNHIHCPVFHSHRWNLSFDLLLSLMTAQASDGVVAIHNERHHAQNHSEEDCVRSSLVGSSRNWLNLVTFFFVAAGKARRKKAADVKRWKTEMPARYRRYRMEQSISAACVVLLFAANWRAALLYFGIPLIAGHWCIVTINLLQHQGCEHDSTYSHSRNVTGAFINWLFLNNGFHTAHHLQPELHWSLLPRLHREVVEPHIRPDLNTNSLFLAIWRQFFSRKV